MKKIYIRPQAEVLLINAEALLHAVSIYNDGSNDEEKGNPDENSNPYIEVDAKKGNTFWDDEW